MAINMKYVEMIPKQWKTDALLSKYILLFLQMKMFNCHPCLSHVLIILHLFCGMYCVNRALKINWVVVCLQPFHHSVESSSSSISSFVHVIVQPITMHFLPISYELACKMAYHKSE